MRLNPWLRCPKCWKIHIRTFIGPRTVCVCGKSLWEIAWK